MIEEMGSLDLNYSSEEKSLSIKNLGKKKLTKDYEFKVCYYRRI